MKQTGMLVVSLIVVNFGFWSHLALIFHAAKVSFRVPQRNTKLRRETEVKFSFKFSF